MKRIQTDELIDRLQADTRRNIAEVTRLKGLDPAILLEQPGPDRWSVVQVIEHLSSYDHYYLVAIEKALAGARPAAGVYRPGWLGDFFTRLMQPREDGSLPSKMKAPAGHRPQQHPDSLPVMNSFIEQQQYLLNLLEMARSRDIGSARVPISLTKLVRLKLGDTFRFLQAHKNRHFLQIENTLETLRGFKGKYPAGLPAN